MMMTIVLKKKALLSCLFAAFLVISVADGAFAVMVAGNMPVSDMAFQWKTVEFAGGAASGRNNGSTIKPGELYMRADNFFLPASQGQDGLTAISKLVFYGGTELDAQVDLYTVTIFSDAGDEPGAPVLSYSEVPNAKYTTDEVTDLGGKFYRQLHKVTLDTTKLELFLTGNQTYYLAIQGFVTNTEEEFHGFDTYKQRFYSLRYADMFNSTDYNRTTWGSQGIAPLTRASGVDFAWEVHVIPEPATCLLLGIGTLMTIRKRKRQ